MFILLKKGYFRLRKQSFHAWKSFVSMRPVLIQHHLEFLSLKGLPESTHVKMLHCWKSHVTAQSLFFLILCNVSPSFMLVAHVVSLFISNISSYSHKGLVARKDDFVAWEQGRKAASTSLQSDLHIFYLHSHW